MMLEMEALTALAPEPSTTTPGSLTPPPELPTAAAAAVVVAPPADLLKTEAGAGDDGDQASGMDGGFRWALPAPPLPPLLLPLIHPRPICMGSIRLCPLKLAPAGGVLVPLWCVLCALSQGSCQVGGGVNIPHPLSLSCLVPLPFGQPNV
ncbi:unnamed protein product [Discosporangium mesarthrocarpum]